MLNLNAFAPSGHADDHWSIGLKHQISQDVFLDGAPDLLNSATRLHNRLIVKQAHALCRNPTVLLGLKI
jgi:hypothetical protein